MNFSDIGYRITPSLRPLSIIIFGLGGSFFLHELGHLIMICRFPEIHAARWKFTFWRISLAALGDISWKKQILIAVSGPGSCTILGIIFIFIPGLQDMAKCYLCHAIFLLPFGGDGNTIANAIVHLMHERQYRDE